MESSAAATRAGADDALPHALADRMEARLRWLLARATECLREDGHPPLPQPTLRLFDHRLDAGRAIPPTAPDRAAVLELNAAYLRAHPDAMLHETLAHEVAHLVVFHIHPRRRVPPHGALWQRVMRQWFGVEPERTHDFDASVVRARRQRRWRYRCGCREHALTTVRHRRAERGARYMCRACGEPLSRFAPESEA